MTLTARTHSSDVLTWADLRRDYLEFVTWASFLSFQTGIWAWEYGNTFALDWALIRRRYPIRPSGVCFVLGRIALLGHYVCQIFFIQSATEISCQSLWICVVMLGTIALNCSNGIFCLRACAVWKYRAAVIIPIAVLWLLQLALWMMEVISIRIESAYLPAMGHTCTSHEKVFMGGVPFILTALVDLTASTLIAVRLWHRGSDRTRGQKIRRLLIKDALIYSLASSPANIAAPLLFWYSKDLPIQTLLLAFALLIHVLLSSRAFIKLHSMGSGFRKDLQTLARNGEHIHPEALEKLLQKSEVTIKMQDQPQLRRTQHKHTIQRSIDTSKTVVGDDHSDCCNCRAHDDLDNSSVHLKAQSQVRDIYQQQGGGRHLPAMPAATCRRRSTDESTDDGCADFTRVNSLDLERCVPLQDVRTVPTCCMHHRQQLCHHRPDVIWTYAHEHGQPSLIDAAGGRLQTHPLTRSARPDLVPCGSDETLTSAASTGAGGDTLSHCDQVVAQDARGPTSRTSTVPYTFEQLDHADITQGGWPCEDGHADGHENTNLPPLTIPPEDLHNLQSIPEGPQPEHHEAETTITTTEEIHRKPIYRQMTLNKLMGEHPGITIANVRSELESNASAGVRPPNSSQPLTALAPEQELLDRHVMAVNYGRCRRTRHSQNGAAGGVGGLQSTETGQTTAQRTNAPDGETSAEPASSEISKSGKATTVGGHHLGFHWRHPYASRSAFRHVPSPSRSARRPMLCKTPVTPDGSSVPGASATTRLHPLSRNRSDSPTLGSLESGVAPSSHIGLRGGSGSMSRARRDRERALVEEARKQQRLTERVV